MSRYIKSISTTRYTGKKSYLNATNTTLTLPAGSTEAKVLVFGGGGNSCSTLAYCCVTCQSYCCGVDSCTFFQSGAGGGYTEKTFSGVSGATACIVVGGAEGTSSFCIPGMGTISATGGSSSGSGSSRSTVPGCGLCGDINRCGGPGSCAYFSNTTRCTCCYAYGPCYQCYWGTSGMLMSGASPGNTVSNGCCGTIAGSQCLGIQSYYTTTNYYGYGCNFPAIGCCIAYVFTSFPAGPGSCPVSSDTYYGFDWDVIGGTSCPTGGQPVTLGLAQCCAYSCSNPNVPPCSLTCYLYCMCAAGQTILATPPGITGSGGPGSYTGSGYNGCGGPGGGGAGICLPVACCTQAYNTAGRTASGGTGMIIIYY